MKSENFIMIGEARDQKVPTKVSSGRLGRSVPQFSGYGYHCPNPHFCSKLCIFGKIVLAKKCMYRFSQKAPILEPKRLFYDAMLSILSTQVFLSTAK